MKSTIRIVSAFVLTFIIYQQANAQTIVGTWQLVKQTSCLEDDMPLENDTIEDMMMKMNAMSDATPQVIKFKEKGTGEESTRILGKRRSANDKNFLYKFDTETLYILDKKSQTIIDAYTVDKFSSDSLILSNASMACETKIFVKIKEAKAN
jgi:hypothetical protein